MNRYEITYNKICYFTTDARDEAEAIEILKTKMKVDDEITIEKIENLMIETSLEETLEFF